MSTIARALLEATVLVVVLLILFLGDWRAATVVVMTLPLSALGTFILMRQFGMSANLMSLGGLAIAIGMLIDAAVVVVENVVAQISHGRNTARLPFLHTIYRGARDVVVPVTSGIAIIIIVFLPLLTLQGLEGKLFIPVALAIVFALSSSLLLSLTVIPVLASFLLRREAHADTWLMRRASAVYLRRCDGRCGASCSYSRSPVSILGVTISVYAQIGKTFMPTMDEGTLIVGIEKLPSVSLEDSAALDLKIQKSHHAGACRK